MRAAGHSVRRGRDLVGARMMAAVCLLAAAVLSGSAATAGSPSTTPRGSCAQHAYTGVAAWAQNEGWVVGAKGCPTHWGLIQRWNGHDWKTVPSPQPGDPPTSCGVHPYAVDAVNSHDAWVVGEYCPTRTYTGTHSLIEHWDGHTWTQIPSPNPQPDGTNRFTTVNAITATDVWAIGYACPLDSPGSSRAQADRRFEDAFPMGAPEGCRPLVDRYNGHRWNLVRVGLAEFVDQVVGPSSDDLWGVGYVWESGDVVAEIRRFNGHSWRRVYTSSQEGTTLVSIAWRADDDVWVGGYGFDDHKVVMHWDGAKWHRMRMPGPGTVNWVGSLSDNSHDGLWAIARSGADYLLEHWNGSHWKSYSYPHQGSDSGLYGLTATYPDFTWAVGVDQDTTHPRALLLHWTGHKWANEARR